MLNRISFVLAVLLVFGLAISGNAGVLGAYGYFSHETVLSNMGYITGFDVAPNGNFIVNNGSKILEVNAQGNIERELFSFESRVYGSFVKYNSTNNKVYFGESSTGAIWSVDYDTKAASKLLNLAFNFEADVYNGELYVTGGLSNAIYRIDETGEEAAADVIVESFEGWASAPKFDADGNLYYAKGNPASELISWSASQISGAIGSGTTTRGDAFKIADIQGPNGLAFDGDGKLYFSDNGYSSPPSNIWKLDNGVPSEFAGIYGNYNGLEATILRTNSKGEICALINYMDSDYNYYTAISTISVPEPTSLMALCSLIGLAASSKLLRSRGK